MSVSVCLCVGLHVCPQTYLRNYMSIFKFSMHVISGGVAIRYVFPVIWTTSYISIVHCLSENEVELSWFINGLDYTKAELRLQPPASNSSVDQSCPWVHVVWPDPTQPNKWKNLDPTRPNPIQLTMKLTGSTQVTTEMNETSRYHATTGFRCASSSWRTFYRAMLCIRSTSHGPVSVRPSVRHKPVFY